jgi:phosphatidylinositol dimannoside acyltransferase
VTDHGAPFWLEEDNPEDRRAYRTIRAAEWLGMHLPRPVGLTLADAYFRVELSRSSERRATVSRNLARVLGHPPESPIVQSATRECFRLYARYWYETFALRTMPPEEVNRRHRIRGIENIDRALDTGRGIIMVLPHMGNWDAAGHWLCLRGYRMTAVAEELKPRSVFELFLRHRRALGMGIVPLSEGRRVGEILVNRLSQNEIITLVADRDLTGRGVEVEMFGAKRLLPAGPARLALGTGAPLCVCAVFTTDEGWHTHIDRPLEFEPSGEARRDATELTKLIADSFERFISAAPVDWHMFQPAWPEDEPVASGAPAGSSPEPDRAPAEAGLASG